MPLSVRDSAAWKPAQKIWKRDGGVWREAKKVWIRDAGVWKLAHESAIPLTLAVSQEDVDVQALAVTAGWDGVAATALIVTIDAGVVIGGSDVSTPAFDIGTMPAGSEVTVVNNGLIVGHHGAPNGGGGGTAFSTGTPTTLINNGTIAGGGGGGNQGAGDSCSGIRLLASVDWQDPPEKGCSTGWQSASAPGGAGGRGAGWHSTGAFWETGAAGAPGGTAQAGSANPGCDVAWQGFVGWPYVCTATGGTGQTGGDLGQAAGGPAGAAIWGHSLLTYEVPGTILGPQGG